MNLDGIYGLRLLEGGFHESLCAYITYLYHVYGHPVLSLCMQVITLVYHEIIFPFYFPKF